MRIYPYGSIVPPYNEEARLAIAFLKNVKSYFEEKMDFLEKDTAETKKPPE